MPDNMIGRVLAGRYRIDGHIGQGGQGAVYRGTHLELGRRVAIKRVNRASPEVEVRFRREASAQASLRHPAIVKLLEFDRDAHGDYFMVQEYVEGRTMSDLLASRGALPLEEAVGFMRTLLDAVGEAHAAGIVHRDLKPSNIMIVSGRRGLEPRLLDFGLAKLLDEEQTVLTQSGAILGTPAYLSPEQVTTAPIGPATDLYSLGVIFYEMLVGRRLFSGTLQQVLLAHVTTPPPHLPPDLPRALDRFVQRALAKAPTERYPSAEAMRDALDAALVAPPPSMRARWLLGFALLGVAGLGVGAALLVGGDRAPVEGDPSVVVVRAAGGTSTTRPVAVSRGDEPWGAVNALADADSPDSKPTDAGVSIREERMNADGSIDDRTRASQADSAQPSLPPSRPDPEATPSRAGPPTSPTTTEPARPSSRKPAEPVRERRQAQAVEVASEGRLIHGGDAPSKTEGIPELPKGGPTPTEPSANVYARELDVALAECRCRDAKALIGTLEKYDGGLARRARADFRRRCLVALPGSCLDR